MPDIHTGAGFDAPAPTIAYAYAPEFEGEAHALVALSERLISSRIKAIRRGWDGDPVTEAEDRELWLRKAAWLDRCALDDPRYVQRLQRAEEAAQQLAEFDREHGTHQGPHGPDSIEWDPSLRPYVRQEYATQYTPRQSSNAVTQ